MFLSQAVEFEKESNNVLKFTVPTRSVARILGRGGASINEIKVNTDAQIDVERATEDGGSVTNITVRGTKKAVAAAKAAILAIADQVGEETTATIVVESRFHRTLIGAGGQGLKDLVIRCGGPPDPKLQAGLIRLCVCWDLAVFIQLTTIHALALVKVNHPTRFASGENRN